MGEEAKAWKTVWSAGQGSGAIHDVPTTAQLVARLTDEFSQACDKFDKKRL
jgi:nitronate monooxygenase